MPQHVKLTRERVRKIEPPATGERTVWDEEVRGLGVRVLASGVKSYIVIYRTGQGRNGTPRRITLGKVGSIRLADAREAALDIRGRVAKGEDPVAERRAEREAKKQVEVTLEQALDRYREDQERRQVSNRANVQASLRNHLLSHVGGLPLAQLDRRRVVEAIEKLEKLGKPGAAKSLRGNTSTFLRWACDKGLIAANPMAGFRAQRATRAQKIEQTGRILDDAEIAAVWHACGSASVNPVFGAFVRFIILTGQRRSETAALHIDHLDEEREWWTVPAELTKNGLTHEVPLPLAARDILRTAPTLAGGGFLFSTNGSTPMSGWSKLMPKLRAAAALESNWTLHDLRRTLRSGLTRLGVDGDVAEIMINHRPETLRSIYDREPRFEARKQAAERWAAHVTGLVSTDRPRVLTSLPMRRSRAS